MIPEYAIFLGVDTDESPVLLDQRGKRGVLFVGDIDFDYIEKQTSSLGGRADFVRITREDLLLGVGDQKILAMRAWVMLGNASRSVLVIESLEEVVLLSIRRRKIFADLFDSVPILAAIPHGRRSIFAALFEHRIVQNGESYLYEELGKTRSFIQNFTPDKVLAEE